MISYDDFKKVEIRAGKIRSAEKILGTDKLLKLSVDFGEYEEIKKPDAEVSVEIGGATVVEKKPIYRQIVSGISAYFPDPAVLVGKTCMFVTNLEPRVIRGFESNGMLFALSTESGAFSILEPNDSIPPGTLAK